MEASRQEINHEIVNYYSEHPQEPVLATVGQDNHITRMDRDSGFPSSAPYIVVPKKITMKRYFQIPADEPAILQQEVQDSGDNNNIWAGEIKGLAPIREILQNTSEEFLLHPIVEDSERLMYASASAEEDEVVNDPNTYVEYYRFAKKNGGSCGYWNCPLHFGGFKRLPWEKQRVLLGQSLLHPWVLRMAKLRRLKRLTDYNRLLLKSLQVTDSMSAIDDDNPHYYDVQQ
jgi:hypothetical protein